MSPPQSTEPEKPQGLANHSVSAVRGWACLRQVREAAAGTLREKDADVAWDCAFQCLHGPKTLYRTDSLLSQATGKSLVTPLSQPLTHREIDGLLTQALKICL